MLAQVSALDKLRQQPTDKPLNLSVTATFPQPKNVGTIVKSTLLHEDKNITHWALSNGMDVLYQRNPAAKKTVYLRMNQRGGRSSLPYSLIPASHLTVDSFIRSGLASMNASELNGYLRRHNTNIMPFIAYAGHGVDITTDTKYLAESLLILHQVLTSATLDPQQFEAVKSERVTRQKSALSSDEGRFEQKMNHNVTRSDSALRFLDTKEMEAIRSEDVQEVYLRLFQNGAPATVAIIGNVDPNELKPLLAQYLGGIQTVSSSNMPLDLGYQAPEKPTINGSYIGNGGLRYVKRIMNELDKTKSGKDVFMDDFLARLLQQRLFREIREKLGAAYSPYLNDLSFDGEVQSDWLFAIETQPKKEKLVEASLTKILNDIQTEITDVEFNSVRRQFLEDMRVSYEDYDFRVWALERYWTYGYGVNMLVDYDKTLKTLDKAALLARAQQLFGQQAHRSNYFLYPTK